MATDPRDTEQEAHQPRRLGAGEAFMREAERDPATREALERVRGWLRAIVEVFQSPDFQKDLERSNRERQEAIERLAEHIRETLQAAGDEMTARGLTGPQTLEEWEHLARIVEMPFETVRSGDYTLHDVYVMALAWIDRQQARERVARQASLTTAQPIVDASHRISDANDDSHLSPAKLAEIFGVPADPLRTRLNRWRAANHTGWIENPDRGSREAKYLYRVGSVRHIIAAMKATSGTTSQRPPKKN